MLDLFLAAFATYFVVINPAGVAVAFATLSEGATARWRAVTAFRAMVVAGAILSGFALGGEWLLGQLGVSLDAFRIAGGGLLFLIAVDMLFERRQQRRDQTAADVAEKLQKGQTDDVSVFPLAIPLTSGPGAIATTLLYMTNHASMMEKGAVMAGAGATLLVTLILLLTVGHITRIMGATVLMVLTRIFGIILAAIAVQFVLDGLMSAFNLGPAA